MVDKKLIVTFVKGGTMEFTDTDELTYDYEIGQYNGCLAILEQRAGNPDGVITVEDEVVIYKTYAAAVWFSIG